MGVSALAPPSALLVLSRYGPSSFFSSRRLHAGCIPSKRMRYLQKTQYHDHAASTAIGQCPSCVVLQRGNHGHVQGSGIVHSGECGGSGQVSPGCSRRNGFAARHLVRSIVQSRYGIASPVGLFIVSCPGRSGMDGPRSSGLHPRPLHLYRLLGNVPRKIPYSR